MKKKYVHIESCYYKVKKSKNITYFVTDEPFDL